MLVLVVVLAFLYRLDFEFDTGLDKEG